MSIGSVRTAIKDAITATGLQAYDYAPGSPNLPCAIVGFPERFDPHSAVGDVVDFLIPVTVMVKYASNSPAEDVLEALLTTDITDPASLVVAIEGIGRNYSVDGVKNFGVVLNESETPTALGCTIDVVVYA